MAKDYTCWDCGYYGGVHEPTCSRKGYLNPSEPKPAPAAPAPRADCPCGIARTDCDYHRPAPAAPYEYGVFDSNGFWVVNGPGVFVYDDAGEQIELPIGAQISFEVMP